MKKLTAGIFATLLAVVSVGAARADIASSQYVDDKVGTVETSVTTLSGRVDTAEGEIETLETGLNAKLDSATAASTYATQSALTSGLAGKQDKELITSAEYATNLSSETGYPSVAAVEAAIDAATDGMVTDVSGKVDVAQGAGAANKAVITGADGNITTGEVTSGMIADGTIVNADISASAAIEASKITGLGGLASQDTVGAGDIEAGAIVNADISASAAIDQSKINGLEASLGAKENVANRVTTTTWDTNKNSDEMYPTAGAVNAAITTATSGITTDVSELTAQVEENTQGIADNASGISTNKSAIGTLTSLTTTEQGNLVGAINEVAGEVAGVSGDIALKQNITDNAFTTAAKTVPGAVNELKTAVDAAADAAEAAQKAADAKIPMPSGECSNPTNKCVLVSNGTSSFEWEVVARGVSQGDGE